MKAEPYSPSPVVKATMAAIMKLGRVKTRRSMKLSLRVKPRHIHAPMPATANVAVMRMKLLSNQSLALPSSSMAVSEPRPMAMTAMPGQSALRSRRRFIGSRSRPQASPASISRPGTQLM